MRQKAAERNPDEFHFGMMSSRTHDRGQRLADRGNAVLSQGAVKLLKTQDAGYLKTMAQKTRRAREKLEHEFVLRKGKGVEVLRDEESQDAQQHIIFAGSRDEQKQFDSEDFFGTTTASLSRRFNRLEDKPRDQHDDEAEAQDVLLSREERDDWKIRRLAKREALAVKEGRVLRKQRKREQEVRRSQLKALKGREKSLLAAEQELEMQRAKMSNSVGGVTKAGVKWKVRERKR